MLKELSDSLDGEALLPKAFEKCGLVPINPMKAMEKIPSTEYTDEIASHVDMNLLKKLETSRFMKKKPCGKKVLAGDSFMRQVEGKEEEKEDVVHFHSNN